MVIGAIVVITGLGGLIGQDGGAAVGFIASLVASYYLIKG